MASRRNASLHFLFTPLRLRAACGRSAFRIGLGLGAALLASAPALAQVPGSGSAAGANAGVRNYRIPAGPLDQALTRYASEAGVELSVDAALTRGKQTPGLAGNYTVLDGFAGLLQGQGLRVVRGNGGAYSLRPAQADGATTLPAVTVTGTAETAWSAVDGYVATRSATGTKTDSTILETPQSISVVTADFIKESGASRLKEAWRTHRASTRRRGARIRVLTGRSSAVSTRRRRATTWMACNCATTTVGRSGRPRCTAPSASRCCAARPRCCMARTARAA